MNGTYDTNKEMTDYINYSSCPCTEWFAITNCTTRNLQNVLDFITVFQRNCRLWTLDLLSTDIKKHNKPLKTCFCLNSVVVYDGISMN